MPRKKIRSSGRFNNFLMIPRKVLAHEDWKNFSSAAKLLYIYLKGRYNGRNNGEIRLPYSALKGIKGLSSPGTVSKAFRELEVAGWIVAEKKGGLFRYVNEYRLTGKVDDCLPKAM